MTKRLTIDRRKSDGNGGFDTATVTITINGVGGDQPIPDQIVDVITDVEDLVDQGILNNGQANPPINFLNQAMNAFNMGKTSKAIDKLDDFIDRVEDLFNDGDLTSAQGQLLIDLANGLIVGIQATS